jgi:hypothetical protein
MRRPLVSRVRNLLLARGVGRDQRAGAAQVAKQERAHAARQEL